MRPARLLLPLAFALGSLSAHAADPIKIGEINSYTALAAFTQPYKKGIELALEEINRAGGVLGRPLTVVFRDDGFKPADAARHAEELVTAEKVDLLAGTFSSGTGLAVADYATRQKILFVASEPLSDALVWDKGSRYVFRLRASTAMQAEMLAAEAAKLPATRWATVAPNYEYGTAFVAAFKQALSTKRPDVQWVGEQWPAQGKLDAGATVEGVEAAKPQAIFNATFGPDLARFVKEGNSRDLFKGRAVVSALTGEPEYLDPLKDETPEGWIVTGYPWSQIDTEAHRAFRTAYEAKFNESPRLGSVVGYTTIQTIAAALKKAGSTETEKLIAAYRGLDFNSPFGPAKFRAGDHQSTMGAFVGKTALKDGRGIMTDWRYIDGASVLPSEEEGRRRRPAEVQN
ncbi:ABC transporter substrate-binding protein [Elstera cyanobacteriorum]|uniref:ABC transporter substrate-binding protein n=1 Tax=Elstera cyanobacteriorum TaxID=2022747 RepID=A0A255XIE2_9PROT|nr:ABC transporter substrate-binding protein [Elstera cyanobacteriorum]OYQ16727.1 ABC transporter substrate-binding protein [Elstera cyanobacteriorum]GFZ88131.1 ABC transporter substrate-binding protein [Elstera cyanobacteriorum]